MGNLINAVEPGAIENLVEETEKKAFSGRAWERRKSPETRLAKHDSDYWACSFCQFLPVAL